MNDNTTTPTYRVADVSPDLAREWLKRNTSNRHLNDKRLHIITGAMKRGEWHENGDAIRFSSDGVLLDGQHRLAAVVKSGITIRSLIVEGLPSDSQITMDVGKARTFADVLALRGITDPSNIATLARRVFLWETGQVRSQNNPPTYAQLLHLVEARLIDLRNSSRVGQSVRRQIPVAASSIGLAHWIFNDIEPDDTTDFFARLRDGQGLGEGHPILVLRDTLLRDIARNGRGRMTHAMTLALIIKGWNAYRKGETVSFLRWKMGGASPEKFPEPI